MNKLDFSDSSVSKFTTEKNAAILEVKDVRYNGALVKVTIKVENYTSLQTDNGPENYDFQSIPTLEKMTDDGEVIVFDSNDVSFSVLITWTKYRPLNTYTRNYKIQGQSLTIDIGSPYPDER